ncbi:YwiC-like family protein [Corynebacterium sp. SCR221107]|uniref:YwiC-like family protein n=1 Tax=Corynebacterium sp. SCR221107 TaxID=3017361 RepID=UPI0022EC3628|nr:YwiC-like family protein [Corynebacterium sp. SCR221107]WBT08550.1 YwiC-like family protein [Corynebacterium sp. SCR221107]
MSQPTSKRKAHWIPNQHGAWAMLVTPAVAGAITGLGLSGGRGAGVVVLIFGAWFAGYFAFFAFGQWARARTPARKAPYRAPMLIPGAISLACVAAVVAARPGLVWFAPLFAPLVAIAVWETLRHRPRSLASGVATTIASALVFPALVAAVSPGLELPGELWLATGFLAAYFTGTIPFVKTMIRERRSNGYLFASIAYHGLMAACVALAWGRLPVVAASLMLVVAVWALVRAVAFPLSMRRGRAWSPKAIGMAEVPLCVLAGLAVVLVGLGLGA